MDSFGSQMRKRTDGGMRIAHRALCVADGVRKRQRKRRAALAGCILMSMMVLAVRLVIR